MNLTDIQKDPASVASSKLEKVASNQDDESLEDPDFYYFKMIDNMGDKFIIGPGDAAMF